MIIGITGRVASGKSQIADLLEFSGFKRYDTDSIIKELEPWATWFSMGKEEYESQFFNDSVFRGEVNFKCSDYLFSMIRAVRESGIYRNIVIESAVLHNSLLSTVCDKTLRVETPYFIRHKRMMRRGYSPDKIMMLEKIQDESNEDLFKVDRTIQGYDTDY